MSFLDKAKKAGSFTGNQLIKSQRYLGDRIAEQKVTVSAKYMGGYMGILSGDGQLVFADEGATFKASPLQRASTFTLSKDEIKDVAIEGRHEVSSRVTVTRLLAVGIFAFALKKKSVEKEAFITFELLDGQEVVFHVNGKTPVQLRASMPAIAAYKKRSATNSSNVGSPVDELSKLAELKDKGFITEAEYSAAKSRLLS